MPCSLKSNHAFIVRPMLIEMSLVLQVISPKWCFLKIQILFWCSCWYVGGTTKFMRIHSVMKDGYGKKIWEHFTNNHNLQSSKQQGCYRAGAEWGALELGTVIMCYGLCQHKWMNKENIEELEGVEKYGNKPKEINHKNKLFRFHHPKISVSNMLRLTSRQVEISQWHTLWHNYCKCFSSMWLEVVKNTPSPEGKEGIIFGFTHEGGNV